MGKSIPSEVRDAEAAALLGLLDALHPRPTNAQFGKAHGIGTAGMVWQYTHARRPLNLEAATKFALGLPVPIERFSPRLAAAAALARRSSARHTPQVLNMPLSAKEPDHAYGWPFSKLDIAAIRRLPPADLARLEDAWLLAAAVIGLKVSKQRAA
jgi:hypothetical protein